MPAHKIFHFHDDSLTVTTIRSADAVMEDYETNPIVVELTKKTEIED